MCILLFSVLSNSVTAWESCFLNIFYKIVVTGPVVSVNIVKISTIFKKLFISLYLPFLLVFLKDVYVFAVSCITTPTALLGSQSPCQYFYPVIPLTTLLEILVCFGFREITSPGMRA